MCACFCVSRPPQKFIHIHIYIYILLYPGPDHLYSLFWCTAFFYTPAAVSHCGVKENSPLSRTRRPNHHYHRVTVILDGPYALLVCCPALTHFLACEEKTIQRSIRASYLLAKTSDCRRGTKGGPWRGSKVYIYISYMYGLTCLSTRTGSTPLVLASKYEARILFWIVFSSHAMRRRRPTNHKCIGAV